MPATYTPIATTTLGATASDITFSSISGSYTDLVLVISGTATDFTGLQIQVGNGSIDTGTNYSNTRINGNGTTAASDRNSNSSGVNSGVVDTTVFNTIINLMSYSNTTTYKTILNRGNTASNFVQAGVVLWRSTSAINIIKIYPNSSKIFNSGTQATLYGVLNA